MQNSLVLRLPRISLGEKGQGKVKADSDGWVRNWPQEEKCVVWRVLARKEGIRKGINQINKQRARLSKKNRLYWMDCVVREVSTERQIFMKPSDSGRHKGLFFIITKWLLPPPHRNGMQNWDIEVLSEDNPLLCILEVHSCLFRRNFSDKLHTGFSRIHSNTGTGFCTEFALGFCLPFLSTLSRPSK
jgi:hypothetical protein